jgi:hypothetical protein
MKWKCIVTGVPAEGCIFMSKFLEVIIIIIIIIIIITGPSNSTNSSA